jgi:hypothetical protein
VSFGNRSSRRSPKLRPASDGVAYVRKGTDKQEPPHYHGSLAESGTFTQSALSKLLAMAAAVLCCAVVHGAEMGAAPQPPCGGATFPAYPNAGDAPVVKTWDRSDLGRNWTPPACTGWTAPGFSTLVVVAARFRSADGFPGLLRHFGAISELTGMRYWSTTRKRWQTLIVDAYALSAETGNRRRKDFSMDEMAEGRSLYFQQADNVSGRAVYRMLVLTASPDRLVVETENVTTMRYLLLPVFPPGEMQSIYFLEREPDDVWRYYSISRTGRNASWLTAGHEASSINRAVAFYRYLAGIPTDQEPPAAR